MAITHKVTDDFLKAFEIVQLWEGGYSNRKDDLGKATNWGITKKTLASWRGKRVTDDDVKALTEEEAKGIYLVNYWFAPKCDKLPLKVAICVFDSSVNQGPRTAVKLLQQTVGAKADGVIGPKTVQLIENYMYDFGVEQLLYSYMAKRALHYTKTLTFIANGYGWFRRLFSVYGYALNIKEN